MTGRNFNEEGEHKGKCTSETAAPKHCDPFQNRQWPTARDTLSPVQGTTSHFYASKSFSGNCALLTKCSQQQMQYHNLLDRYYTCISTIIHQGWICLYLMPPAGTAHMTKGSRPSQWAGPDEQQKDVLTNTIHNRAYFFLDHKSIWCLPWRCLAKLEWACYKSCSTIMWKCIRQHAPML